MLLPVILAIFVALVALLIGAQKFRDRNRYKGESTLDTDGHARPGHVALDRQESPPLLGPKSETLGMGFPGSSEAQGPNQ